MRRYVITLSNKQTQQLHQMALKEHRTVQQAAYLLDRAIDQAAQEGNRCSEQEEVSHAPAP
jgi:hypothetical protein